MPRHTLDKWTYKLKTMDVCLTKHKEDDIYNHMVKMHAKMQELYEKYKLIFDKIIKEDLDSDKNMYKKYNWRQGEPSRFWLKNANNWHCIDEAESDREFAQNEFFLYYRIWADFMICDKEDHGHDWLCEKEGWTDMVNEVDYMHNFLKNSYDTITLYENMAYHEAKQEWERIDRAWIEENDRKKEHKKHPLIERPSTTNLDVIPEPYPEQPLRHDCSYCRQHWEEMKPKYELAVQIWSKNKQEEIAWEKQKELENEKSRKERERKAKEYEQWIARQDPVELHCHDCGFEAEDEEDLEHHKQSEEHKKRSRYCKVCQLQCRNDADYAYHIETMKHKKNAGIIEKVKIYKCNHCDYQTTVKCNFEKHIVAKNHMD